MRISLGRLFASSSRIGTNAGATGAVSAAGAIEDGAGAMRRVIGLGDVPSASPTQRRSRLALRW